MTTSSRKNYNILALRGQDVDDMDVVKDHGLDPSVAYTPKINDAMLDKIESDNITFYIEDKNMSEVEAKTVARNNRRQAEGNIRKLMR